MYEWKTTSRKLYIITIMTLVCLLCAPIYMFPLYIDVENKKKIINNNLVSINAAYE